MIKRQGFIFCYLIILVVDSIYAQDFVSPGYPWTYVPRTELPMGVEDLEFESSLDTSSLLCQDSEIRRIFYMYVHPEFAVSDTLDQFPIIVPRDPGVVDTITMLNFYQNIDSISTGGVASIGGLFSEDRPEYFSSDIELVCFYRSSGDTTCDGYIARLPSTYLFVNNLLKRSRTRWLNLIQCVDSIWHPPIVSSGPEILIGEMDRIHCYPIPAEAGGGIHVRLPRDWPRSPSELLITGGVGRILFRRHVGPLKDGDAFSLPPELSSGTYTLVIKTDGRIAGTRLIVN